jgi:hypothetical protein
MDNLRGGCVWRAQHLSDLKLLGGAVLGIVLI